MTYTLGMTGPINLADLREFIDPTQWHEDLPKGQGGSPVNLLCRELLKRGQRLVVFSCDSAVKDEVILEGENLKLCVGPKGVRPARNFFRVEREYLARAIQREKPDVIHAQWTYEYALPVQRSGIPHLITAHDAPINILRHNFIPYRIARTLMAYRVLARAKRVASVSPYIADHLARYMFYRGPGEVIPNGMPASHFERPASPPPERPVTFATILVGWAGRKNGQVAVEALALVRKTHPDARLLMFGDGHGLNQEAHQWATRHGLAEGIEFVGHLPYDQLQSRLATEVDVMVHPALEEAFGMTFIEAMALRIPVIGGVNAGAVPWVLDHGRAGVLTDVTSAGALGEAMRGLADSAAERRRLGQVGWDWASRQFHIASVADACQAAYADLLEAR